MGPANWGDFFFVAPDEPKPPALTPAAWLAMLPAGVAQLSPAQREEFVMQILQACDQAGVELAGCMADEFEAARGWR
jgi:hypothetical protein